MLLQCIITTRRADRRRISLLQSIDHTPSPGSRYQNVPSITARPRVTGHTKHRHPFMIVRQPFPLIVHDKASTRLAAVIAAMQPVPTQYLTTSMLQPRSLSSHCTATTTQHTQQPHLVLELLQVQLSSTTTTRTTTSNRTYARRLSRKPAIATPPPPQPAPTQPATTPTP